MTVITGGEPLLVINQVAPHIKSLTDAGVAVSMNTNLTLLTPEKARMVKDLGVHAFLTSMPSGVAETCDRITSRKNSLSRIIRGITVALESGFPVYVNMVVSKMNFSEIEASAKLAFELGVRSFSATRASNPVAGSGFTDQVLGRDEFRQMISRLTTVCTRLGLPFDSLEANPPCAFGPDSDYPVHRFCGAGKNTCTIGHDGQVRPCNRLPLTYGHIDEGLQAAWNQMAECRSSEWIPQACGQCKLKARCGGGCKADSLVAYGDVKLPDPLCDHSYQATVKAQPVTPTTADRFTVNPGLKLRVEDFGAIAYVNISNWVPVDERMAQILLPRAELSLEKIMNSLSTNETAARLTAGALIGKKILSPVSG
jgi:radical SAM protein with 4Fe4S-binding SPASM domain